MFKLFLCLFFVSSTPIRVVNEINKERSKYGINKINYNWELHNHLKQYKNNGSWLYSDNDKYNYSFTYNNETRVNRLNGAFLSKFNNETYKYIYRDTYKDSILKIIKYRNRQRDCFNESKCSDNNFNYYVSCMNSLDLMDGKKCSWANSYYPKHLLSSLKSIAVLSLNYEGRFLPDYLQGIQKKSFWIYGYYGNVISDNPLKN